MGHANTISALKALIKLDLFEITPDQHGDNISNESDRSTIILTAAMIERFVLEALKSLMSNANKDERDRIFNFEGPCGSFSNRIRLAHALGVFNRQTKRQIEIIKEMRNAAAHSVSPITFDTVEIRQAIASLMPEEHQVEILGLDRLGYKHLLDRACARLNVAILDPDGTITFEQVMEMVRTRITGAD